MKADDYTEGFVNCDTQVLTRNRLHRSDKNKLRHLIEGPVAAMTAEQLSVDLDVGLENHARYESAITGLHRLILDTGNRLDQLLSCLENTLPANSPPSVKVLVAEAVARKLGREWSQDTSSFIDVTIASARLQDLAQALSIEAADRIVKHPAPFAAILLPKDEQHSLMAYLTGAFFQAFGWQHQVLTHDQSLRQEFAGVVGRADAICIGWSNMRLRPQLRQLVDDIRLYAPSKNQPMIAGGVATLESVEFLVEMGIDCICDTAYSAVKIAENFNNLEKMDFIPLKVRSGHDAQTRRIDWRNP
ncbi:MAG: cobalamin-binding protein [Roseibium sp.]|uniref:cobalamin-binding protein n=1 Tax=Roseibium sp. TaxID=1936156 RepID=UPI003D9C14AD